MTQFAMNEPSEVKDSDWKYPQAKANRSGHIQVDNDPCHELYWEEYGNPDGEPVMFLHGGPGGGSDPSLARFFDPARYRVILFDQRGCGKSKPNAATDGVKAALANNTTGHLVDDIAKLRAALDIKGKMHAFGGSWGSTLALAYAIKYPQTVETLILRGIFIGSKEDLLYMYQGNAATYAENPYGMPAPGAYIFYPDAWKQYVEVIPHDKRGNMMNAYKEIFDKEPTTEEQRAYQMRAVKAWSIWEGAISYLSPDMESLSKFEEDGFAICFAQIEAHYFANNLFMPENYLINNLAKLAGIGIHIVHGIFDQVCPLTQACILDAALKKAGIEPVSFYQTIAGHSMMERANNQALTKIMDTLPRMAGYDLRYPAAPAGVGPQPAAL